MWRFLEIMINNESPSHHGCLKTKQDRPIWMICGYFILGHFHLDSDSTKLEYGANHNEEKWRDKTRIKPEKHRRSWRHGETHWTVGPRGAREYCATILRGYHVGYHQHLPTWYDMSMYKALRRQKLAEEVLKPQIIAQMLSKKVLESRWRRWSVDLSLCPARFVG